MRFRATLNIFAVTTGASSFSKFRLLNSWRRNSRASDCDICGSTRLRASSKNTARTAFRRTASVSRLLALSSSCFSRS